METKVDQGAQHHHHHQHHHRNPDQSQSPHHSEAHQAQQVPRSPALNYNPYDGTLYDDTFHSYQTAPHSVYCPRQPHSHLPYIDEPAGKPPTTALPPGGEEFYDVEAARGIPSGTPWLESVEGSMRLAFLRKVYGILSIQLLVTVAVSCLFMFVTPIQTFVMTNRTMFYGALVLSFATLIALICVRTKYPTNMILLGVWTCVEAYTIGIITATFQAHNAGSLVLQAFIITGVIFIGLTCFTFAIRKRVDLSIMGPMLFAALLGLFTWGIITWILGWRQSFLYSLLGAIIFSLLIVYDSWMLSERLGPDDWLIGSISLYLDLINLFLFILSLLGRGGVRE